MRKSIITLSLITLLSSTCFAIPAKQRRFIDLITSETHKADEILLQQRHRLKALHTRAIEHHDMSDNDISWLNHMADNYKVSLNVESPEDWQTLLRRVDIIPTSLIVAQAANETAWGASRFAKHANNYFGQQCYTKGCGIVPKHRSKGKSHEVKRFNNVFASVFSYIHNINTNHAYKKFRILRAKLRSNKKTLNSLTLATGLKFYSEIGIRYVKSIQSIIKHYALRQYDINA